MVAHGAGMLTKIEGTKPFQDGYPARESRSANGSEGSFATVLGSALFGASGPPGSPKGEGGRAAETLSAPGTGIERERPARQEDPSGDSRIARTPGTVETVPAAQERAHPVWEKAFNVQGGEQRRAERRGRGGERSGTEQGFGPRAARTMTAEGAASKSSARLGASEFAKGAHSGTPTPLAAGKPRGGEPRHEPGVERAFAAGRLRGGLDGKAAALYGKLAFSAAEKSRMPGEPAGGRAVRATSAPPNRKTGAEPVENRRGNSDSSQLKTGETVRGVGRTQLRKAGGEGFAARRGADLETDRRIPGVVEQEKPTVKPVAPSEVNRVGGELFDAATKYEASVARAAPRTDYVIQRNTDEILSEIVKNFTLVARRGGGEAHITLQPDFLGRMKLDLKLRGKEVNTLIVVDNQALKDLIVNRLAALEQSLLEHGLSLGSFQVEVKDGGQGLRAAYREGQERSSGSERPDGSPEREPEPLEIVAPAYGLPWLSTVVNVTA